MNPLILSLRLDPKSDVYFNCLRERYFPSALNIVPAHVTLFHHLPGEHVDDIVSTLEEVTAKHKSMHLTVTGLRNLGRGVAYTLESDALAVMRKKLAEGWQDWLTPQDRQKFRPHITVQNKVTPELARETLTSLQISAGTSGVVATGLHLWEYRNGPWEHRRTFAFSIFEGDSD